VDPDPQVSCDHPSGGSFPQGVTEVTCTATDFTGNTASASFDVTVAGGNLGLSIMSQNYPNFVQGTVPPADATDTVESYATSVPGLTYDAAADQYVYVWKTDKGWAGKSGTLKVKLADGSMHTALFSFTK
jgi:HYR domain